MSPKTRKTAKNVAFCRWRSILPLSLVLHRPSLANRYRDRRKTSRLRRARTGAIGTTSLDVFPRSHTEKGCGMIGLARHDLFLRSANESRSVRASSRKSARIYSSKRRVGRRLSGTRLDKTHQPLLQRRQPLRTGRMAKSSVQSRSTWTLARSLSVAVTASSYKRCQRQGKAVEEVRPRGRTGRQSSGSRQLRLGPSRQMRNQSRQCRSTRQAQV
jgi:hypothetical protein